MVTLVSQHLFCLFCTTCRNPEDKGGLLDEVWDEESKREELREERVTGLQSGFDRLNLAGYREAVLGEFDHSEELGRQEGFRQGFVANPEANPTLALACMEGQLIALSHRPGQGGAQSQVSCCLDFVPIDIHFYFIFLINSSHCITCSLAIDSLSIFVVITCCTPERRGTAAAERSERPDGLVLQHSTTSRRGGDSNHRIRFTAGVWW